MISPEYSNIAKNISTHCKVENTGMISKDAARKRAELLMLMNSDVFVNSHTTSMFRQDIDWNKLADLIKTRYRDDAKVNTRVYACSSGEEAYSVSILLQEKLKGKADKFFPIEAKDIDKDTVEAAKNAQKSGKVPVFKNSLKKGAETLRTTTGSMSKYIESKKDEYSDYILENASKPVQFSCADILKDIDTIDSNTPTIVLCRNMWAYIKDSEYWSFAKELYDKLAPKSAVIVGGFDKDAAPEILWALGYYFKQDGLIFLKD